MKCIDMFCESIPSSVLQTYALLDAKSGISSRAVSSIVVSAVSIAYSSTMISSSFDTSPLRRSETPQFYGYFPDDGRLIVTVCMIFMTTGHVLMKVIASALFFRLSSLWLMLYMAGDMGLFFLYKIARGDLKHWMVLPDAFSFFLTILNRVVTKTIADYTLIVQFRRK